MPNWILFRQNSKPFQHTEIPLQKTWMNRSEHQSFIIHCSKKGISGQGSTWIFAYIFHYHRWKCLCVSITFQKYMPFIVNIEQFRLPITKHLRPKIGCGREKSDQDRQVNHLFRHGHHFCCLSLMALWSHVRSS